MNGNLALTEKPIGRIRVAARRTGTERLVLTLTALGMIASLVAFLSFREATVIQANPHELVQGDIIKSQLYYLAHAAEITLLVSAGLLSLLSTDFRTVNRGYLVRLFLLFGAALLMTARGYTFADLFSTRIADSTGPFPFLISVLVFVGCRWRNWIFLGKAMVIMAALFSGLALLGMAGLQIFSRQEAVINLGLTLNVLYWPASWIALHDCQRPSLWSPLRFIPILIYSLGSLLVQTRLNFVMIFSLLAVYTFLQRKRRLPQGPAWITGLSLVVWAGLFTSSFLTNTRAFERIERVAADFSSRLDEDTRTGQLVFFFEDVQPQELLLGRGSFATWIWGGLPWKGGTDVGYLSLLLYGGLPLLLAYTATHLVPCLTVLRKKAAANWQLTAAGLVLLWSVRMFSSDYPNVTLEYYPILFCVGACISMDFSDRDRRVPVEPLGS